MAETRSVRVRISGIVQGVGYRAWTVDRATALGLSGTVRNCRNGDVEAVFSGPAETVAAMLAACEEGPRHALVDTVEIVDEAAAAARGFRVTY